LEEHLERPHEVRRQSARLVVLVPAALMLAVRDILAPINRLLRGLLGVL
jgi:hypothetical protein